MSYDVGILIRKNHKSNKIELVEFSCSDDKDVNKIGDYDTAEKALSYLESNLNDNPYESISVDGFNKRAKYR